MVKIAFPFNGGIRVVSHACQVSQVSVSIKDTCPTPHSHMRALTGALRHMRQLVI